MSKPKVSVIMSVYKEPLDWLCQSVDSILNQTFADFEFIIICDNPDYSDCINLLERYSQKDSRIKLIYNEKNIGLTKSLNKGLFVAKGDFIARMDADDVSLPNRFERQIQFLERHPEFVALGTAAYILGNGNKRTFRHSSSSQILKSLSIFDSPIIHPSVIFRRIIDGNPIAYNENYRCAQDYELWVRLMSKFELSNLEEPLIRYRVSANQITKTQGSEQKRLSILILKNAFINLDIKMSERDFQIFCYLRKLEQKEINHREIEAFLVDFSKRIKTKSNLSINKIKQNMMLLYANYLPFHFNLIIAIYSFVAMSVKMRIFSPYSLLSLVRKYISLG